MNGGGGSLVTRLGSTGVYFVTDGGIGLSSVRTRGKQTCRMVRNIMKM